MVNLSSTSSPVGGKIAQALSFNGVSQYVLIPHGPMFNLSTPTYSAWIKTTQTGIQYIIDHDVYYGGSLILSNGALEFNHSGATTTAITSTKVNDGTWHFVAMTFDGAYVRLYIDGALQGTFYGPSLGFLSFEDLYIGERGNNGNFFNGSIDDVRIYNRALTTAEIQALAQGKQ